MYAYLKASRRDARCGAAAEAAESMRAALNAALAPRKTPPADGASMLGVTFAKRTARHLMDAR